MRQVNYTTWDERQKLCAEALAAGEQMYHDDHLADGTKRLTFDAPQPGWVRYFQSIMPEGQAVKETPLDMPAARVYHMGKIREVRDRELAKLDVLFMRTLEEVDVVAQAVIISQKQVLRNLPVTFDLSTKRTGATLQAAWPSELPAR